MRINKSLENFQTLLLYFLPLTLITGSFLSDLSVSIIGLIFLYLTISQKEFKYYKLLPAIIFWFWCLYLIIISSFSQNPFLSFESSLFYFRFGLFALAICYVIEHNINFKRNFFIILTIVFIVVIFDGFLEFFLGRNLLNFDYDGLRIKGLFGDNLAIGSYLARLLPIIFALFYSEFFKTKKMILFLMILLIATDVLIYVSGERTSFFIVSLLSVCIILLTSQFRLIRIATLIISVGLILIITVSKENVRDRMVTTTINQIFDERVTVFSSRHESFYSTSINIINDNYMFGIGPKMYREACANPLYSSGNSCSTHPHNTYIQLLSETGIIGTLPVIFLFLSICYIFVIQLWSLYIKKTNLVSDYKIFLLISLFVSLWPFMPSQNFFNNWISIIYYLPAGFLLYEFSIQKFIKKF